jgi:hypothetical protein
MPGQRHVPRDQPSNPPVREVKHFEYENSELIRRKYITYRSGLPDTVIHENSGIDLLKEINAARITSKNAAGLPLVITGEQIIVVRPFPDRPRSAIHLHYHHERPAILSKTDDLNSYLQFHPPY